MHHNNCKGTMNQATSFDTMEHVKPITMYMIQNTLLRSKLAKCIRTITDPLLSRKVENNKCLLLSLTGSVVGS